MGLDHVDGSRYAGESFGVYLRRDAGYQVGLFGKANFNTFDGFDRWFQGFYDGYGREEDQWWDDDECPSSGEEQCQRPGKYLARDDEYATSLIGNKTIEWLRRPSVGNGERPFFAYFAPACPHTPATPADWYSEACHGVVAPRDPSWNHSHPSFHELVAKQPPLTEADARLVDKLARSRCQCLLSVDDAYAAIDATLRELDVVHKTYWFVSSDHGYNLGQHRLTSNKFLLYDHSLLVPMLVRGPGVPSGARLPHLGTNVDLAPTWLELAGLSPPSCMDGRSMLSFLLPNASAPGVRGATRARLARVRGPPGSTAEAAAAAPDPAAYRTEAFVQYYNQGLWSPENGGNECPICTGHSTTRDLDDASNTYIGLHVRDPQLGAWKYGEYQNVCTAEELRHKTCFTNLTTTELFDLDEDPHELLNVAATAPAELLAELHRRVHAFYGCQGRDCP